LDAALGAEIVGLDLSLPASSNMIAAIRRAFLESGGLLVFRDQILSPEQHVAISRQFGPLITHILRQYALPEHPEILRVSNVIRDGKPVGLGDAGSVWHSDLSYTSEPSLGSMLYALEVPKEGGDTSFADMTAAYAALPVLVKQQLQNLYAVHSYSHYYARYAGSKWRPPLTNEQKREVPEVVHPVVRIHPETGHESLFVNEAFTMRIAGMAESQSRELLQFLFSHSTNPAFVYRHRWKQRDLVFWDNRCTIHLAHGCLAQLRRHMHRTTIKGQSPIAWIGAVTARPQSAIRPPAGR
jgi:taurine dioxygenase